LRTERINKSKKKLRSLALTKLH